MTIAKKFPPILEGVPAYNLYEEDDFYCPIAAAPENHDLQLHSDYVIWNYYMEKLEAFRLCSCHLCDQQTDWTHKMDIEFFRFQTAMGGEDVVDNMDWVLVCTTKTIQRVDDLSMIRNVFRRIIKGPVRICTATNSGLHCLAIQGSYNVLHYIRWNIGTTSHNFYGFDLQRLTHRTTISMLNSYSLVHVTPEWVSILRRAE